MKFLEIEFDSDDYRKECILRNVVLRIPLGLNLFDEDLSLESQQKHFGLFDESGNLVACAITVSCTPTAAKIRQMAVAAEHHGRGYGSGIIRFIEGTLSQQGITHLQMHARMTAVRFYEKLGYVRVGQEFIEVGIPHIKMEKIFK